MAGLEIRESVTVAGRAERARVARVFVGGAPAFSVRTNLALSAASWIFTSETRDAHITC
jgi:hypothetical protein